MTDTVLQSFCERCGTRYTFTEQEEAPGGGRSRLARLGRRSNQDAASEPTISTTLPSSERFEGTFHFCLECRQYTCAKCWNPQEGYCLSCRPPGGTAAPGDTSSSAALTAAPTAWPSDDVKKAASAPAPGHGHEHSHPIPQPRPADAGPSTATPSETQVRPNDGATSEGQGQASKDDGPASGTGDTNAAPEPGKTASPAASDDALKHDPELPWSTAAKSADEWGRPLADQPAAPEEADVKPEVSHASGGKDAIDPWRGVVFSEEGAPSQGADVVEQAAQRVDFSSSSTDDPFDRMRSDAPQAGSAEEGEQPASGMPVAPSAWPKIDRASEAAAQPPGDDAAWPAADHQEDESATERLASISPTIEDKVDARDWARSSDAVVSSSGLLEGDGNRTEEPAHDGGTPTDQAAPSVSDTASAAGQAEPEEEQLSAAERILGVAGVTAAATAGTLTDEAAQPEQAIAPVSPEAPSAETPGPEPAAAPSAPEVPVDATLTFVDAVLPEPEPAIQAEATPDPEPSLPDGPQEIETPSEAVPAPPEVALTTPVPAAQRSPVAPVEPVEPPARIPQATPPALIPPVAAPGPFAEPYREPTASQDPPAAPIAATQAESAAPPTPMHQPSTSPRPQLPAETQGPVLAPPAVAMQQPQMPPPLAAPAMPPPQATPADARSGFVPPPPLPMPTAPPAAKRTGSHACTSCGLPLSAKARFCRRCGAPQASA